MRLKLCAGPTLLGGPLQKTLGPLGRKLPRLCLLAGELPVCCFDAVFDPAASFVTLSLNGSLCSELSKAVGEQKFKIGSRSEYSRDWERNPLPLATLPICEHPWRNSSLKNRWRVGKFEILTDAGAWESEGFRSICDAAVTARLSSARHHQCLLEWSAIVALQVLYRAERRGSGVVDAMRHDAAEGPVVLALFEVATRSRR